MNIVWFQLHEIVTETEAEKNLLGAGGWVDGYLFNGFGVSLLENEESLEMDSGDGLHNPLNVPMALNCTPQNG